MRTNEKRMPTKGKMAEMIADKWRPQWISRRDRIRVGRNRKEKCTS